MPLRNRSGLRAATVELQFNFAAAAPPSSHRLAFSHSHANISSTQCGIILCALRRAAVHCRHNPRLKVTARPIAPNDPSKGPSRRRPQPRAARHWPRLLPGTVTAALLGLSGPRGTTSWTTTSVAPIPAAPKEQSVRRLAAEERHGQSVLLAALACARWCPMFARSVRVELTKSSTIVPTTSPRSHCSCIACSSIYRARCRATSRGAGGTQRRYWPSGTTALHSRCQHRARLSSARVLYSS